MESKKVSTDLLYALVNPQLETLSYLYKERGYELRIVGGAVRDILLNKEPKDIDLASDATPEESIELLADNEIRMIPTGLQHGTVTAHIEGVDYEITTLRVDVSTDGRHAEVEYTADWEVDAARRDLTFNAMSMDFDGNLYDYYGGYEDLKNGIARFVGDPETRVTEDYLRILRYFRFQGRMAQPDFDESTLDTIAKNAEGLKSISGERIWMEMSKILSGNHVVAILDRMYRTGVLANIGLPYIATGYLRYITAVSKDPVLILASLLKSQEQANAIYNHWKLPNKVREVINLIIATKDMTIDKATAKKLIVLKGVRKDLMISLLTFTGQDDILREIESWEIPVFPVSGKDLINAGISPGPKMGAKLKFLKNAWADSGFELSKEELLNL